MLDCLTIDNKYWINGSDMLWLANYAIGAINTSGNLPGGDGSYDRPWRLDGDPKTWMQTATAIRAYANSKKFFYICGRFVMKAEGYYMVDAGGNDGSADGYQPWDRMPSGGAFERGGPSYRNYATRLKKLHQEHLNHHRRDGQGLSNEKWTEEKAKKLQKVLLADPEYANKLKTKGDWSTGQVLPVLAATWFIAEPARNMRCFLINKMLLDLMVTASTYGGRKKGSAPKQYKMDTVAFRDPHDKGGKLPAAMTGSADAGRGALRPDPTALGTALYTQAKELTILCNYFSFGSFKGTNEGLLDKKAYKQIAVNKDPTIDSEGAYSGKGFERDPAKVPGYLKYLMMQTITSFKQ